MTDAFSPQPLPRMALMPAVGADVLEEERALLALVASGRSLSDVLEAACLAVERLRPGACCSIMLAAPDAQRLTVGAAPNLPRGYLELLADGVPIGPCRGSCGTAAWRRSPVIAADVEVDPNWQPYRGVGPRYGFRACWSSPILAADGAVMGTYAIYYPAPRAPEERDLALLDTLTHVLGVAIQKDRTERRLERSEQRYRQMVEALAEGVLLLAPNGEVLYANAAAGRILSVDPTQLRGHPGEQVVKAFLDEVGRVLQPDQWPTYRALELGTASHDEIIGVVLGDGRVRWVSVTCLPIFPDTAELEAVAGALSADAVMVSFEDVTDVREAQHRIGYLASHDPLTGLLNRVAFEDALGAALIRRRGPQRLAVLYVDLDRFKGINDSLGHQIGDLLLRHVAGRLTEAVGDAGVLARWGGDEFVAMLEDVGDAAAVERIARRIVEAVGAPLAVDAYELSTGASVGMCMAPEHGTDVHLLLRNADLAMYRAKEMGRRGAEWFHPELNARAARRVHLEAGLRQAIERDELRLVYQPIVDLHTLAEVGVEALLRWRSDTYGDVPPNEFIPIAEDSELIVPLGEWVLDRAMRDAARWHARAPDDPLRVSINLSAKQFLWSGLAGCVERMLLNSGALPQAIDFELTESLLLSDSPSLGRNFSQMKRLGIGLSIDDFGTGYSSLAYLMRFPISTLKIDRTFIQRVPHDREATAITEAIVAMAAKLGMRTVAEGVETQAQLDFLRYVQCDALQGFLASRPLDVDVIDRRLAAGQPLVD